MLIYFSIWEAEVKKALLFLDEEDRTKKMVSPFKRIFNMGAICVMYEQR